MGPGSIRAVTALARTILNPNERTVGGLFFAHFLAMAQRNFAHILLAGLLFLQSLFAPVLASAAWDTRVKMVKAVQAVAMPEKTQIAKAVDELMLGRPSAIPKGQAAAGGLSAPVINKAGEVVSNILLAPGKKINPITWLRLNGKKAALKTGKFMAVDLPIEAFAFFLALGAIHVSQTYLDYAENPVSLEQHLNSNDVRTAEGQIGLASLGVFMAANRSTESLLYNMIGPQSRMKGFVPYLGMSVGFLASSLMNEVANFDQLKKCVAALKVRINQEEKYATCERAYDSWNEAGLEKMQQYAPTIMAMVTSTLTAGIAESLVQKVITATSWRLVLEIGVTISPIGWTGQAIKWTYRIGSMVLFTKLQQMQEPGLTQWWKNWMDGNEMERSVHAMMFQIDRKKRNGWQPLAESEKGSKYDLDLEIHKFSQHAKEWRKGNMLDILNSHGAWLQFLTNFSNTYKAAMAFDSFFIGEYDKKFNQKVPSLLDEPYYLAGVAPAQPADEQAELDLLNNKKDYEDRQLEHLIAVRAYYEKWLGGLKPEEIAVSPQYFADIREVLSYLPTQAQFSGTGGERVNLARIAKGLDLLNTKLKVSVRYPGVFQIPYKVPPGMKPENQALLQLRQQIGEPWPLYQPGTGFLSAYDQNPERASVLSLLRVDRFWQKIRLPKPSHYLLAQILKGPRADLGQSVIKAKDGFPLQFVPPRLVESFGYQIIVDPAQESIRPQPTIFNTPVMVQSAKPLQFKNAFDILRGPNILKSVSTGEEGFMGWWNKYVENQYINAWNKYESEYQSMIVKLLERYYFSPKEENTFIKWWHQLRQAGLNSGPMANGLRMSFLQERRLYLMILGEVLRDQVKTLGADHPIFKTGFPDAAVDVTQYPLQLPAYQDQTRQRGISCDIPPAGKSPEQLVQERNDCLKAKKAGFDNEATQVPILKILGHQQSYNLSRIFAAYKHKNLMPYGSENVETHFEFQDRISIAFEEMESLINQMQVVETQGGKATFSSVGETVEYDRPKKFVSTTVTNRQITAAQENIQKILEEIDAPLIEDLAPANRHVFEIVQACMIGLQNLAQQQADMAKMVNLVSYTRSVDKEETSTGPSGLCAQGSLFTTQKSLTGQIYVRKGCEAQPPADNSTEEEKINE